MMTSDGRLFIIDIIGEKLKDKTNFQDEMNNNMQIADAKLDNAYNTLVFRDNKNQFFWVPNVLSGISPLVTPTAFHKIESLS